MDTTSIEQWARENALSDSWFVWVENEEQFRDDPVRLSRACGMACQGGWRICIKHVSQIDDENLDWVTVDPSTGPPAQPPIITAPTGSKGIYFGILAIVIAGFLMLLVVARYNTSAKIQAIEKPNIAPAVVAQVPSKKESEVPQIPSNKPDEVKTPPPANAFPVIKGFAIGMKLGDFKKLLTERYKMQLGGYYHQPGSNTTEIGGMSGAWGPHDPESPYKALADFDENDECIGVMLQPRFVNEIFNVSDLTAADFVQQFIDSYNIPEMKAEQGLFALDLGAYGPRVYPSGWYYADAVNGYEIIIFENKAVEIVKIQKGSPKVVERHFD